MPLTPKLFLQAVLACLLGVMSVHASANNGLIVKGLFAGRAALEVHGKAHLLKEGQSSPEGVTLLRATSKFAQVEYNGEIKTLYLNRQVGANYAPAAPTEVRIQRGANGHFFASGRINNRFVQFLVDTGASKVTLNSFIAEQLGIDFKAGTLVKVETASGFTQGYQVALSSVAIGDLLLTNVSALVLEGRHPQTILLGNSYLNRVNLSTNSVAMVLKAKY